MMRGPDYSKRDYLLPKGCKDLVDALIIPLHGRTTTAELAELLRQKPTRLLADLFRFGVFASTNQPLNFETASRVVRKYGYVARLE